MDKRVKEYLDKLATTDTAFAEKYDDTRLDDCWEYIKDNAQQLATNGCACIEDATVFKWARDFFFDVKHEVKAEEKKEEVKEKPKAEKKPVKENPDQMLFDFGE